MYQALYRKYRPVEFEAVVGQDVVVKTLKNAVIHNHINHAYLFSGPRGTGKTTIAKIFARLVNCENPIDGIACGKCKNCQYSFAKECMDIIEIDAASNNGVDEIRELRNKVNILPSELKYKVYIIDEVHMLSIGAFNALLKTIEEPPKHVIFILATTDPQKIPATIISRCQWYSFKKISNNDIVYRLEKIVKEEKIPVENDVLLKIAETADGGLRDAIGLLDKLWAYCDDKITVDKFYEMNGQLDDERLNELKKLIFSNQIRKVLSLIEQIYCDGKNLLQIIKQLIISIKDDLFNYYMDNSDLSYDEVELVKFLNYLNEKIIDIKKADDSKISIEICLLHYMKNMNSSNKKNVCIKEEKELRKTEKQEKEVLVTETKIDKKSSYVPSITLEQYKNIMLIRSKNTMIKATKDELNKENNNILKCNSYTFDQTRGYLACELLDGKVRAASDENIIISYDYESMVEKMSSHFLDLISFYNEITNSNKKIAFISVDEWDKLRSEYIELKKQGKQFEYIEEPTLNIDNNNDKISSDNSLIKETIDMFGDIVEIN